MKSKKKSFQTARQFSGSFDIGFEFAGIVAIPALLGYFADTRFETLPLWLLVGLSVGFFYGIWYILRKVRETPGGRNEESPLDDATRMDRVEKGLDEVGKKIDRLGRMSRRPPREK